MYVASGSGLQTPGQGLPPSCFMASPLMALCRSIRWLRSFPRESAPPMRNTHDSCTLLHALQHQQEHGSRHASLSRCMRQDRS